MLSTTHLKSLGQSSNFHFLLFFIFYFYHIKIHIEYINSELKNCTEQKFNSYINFCRDHVFTVLKDNSGLFHNFFFFFFFY